MDFISGFIVQLVVTAIMAIGSLGLQVAEHRRRRRRLSRITEARIRAEVLLRLITAEARAAMRRAAREQRRKRRRR